MAQPRKHHSFLQRLRQDATIADLPLHDFRIAPQSPARLVAEEFERHPELPGALISDEGRIQGVISREQFFRVMSRPLANDVYLGRPIELLHRSINIPYLELPADCPLHEAAIDALERPLDQVYEPIVVMFDNGLLRLLQVHVLLLAQSRLLTLANELIQQQVAAADSASHAKSQFLANMSHEIRTPLNGIIGMTNVVLEMSLERSARRYLEMVRTSANWLMEVINDVLDFSKIEAGKIELEEVSFNLRDSLRDIMKTLAFRAQDKNLELLLNVAEDVPDRLRGDIMRLRQVLVNLTGNAIKFTHEGEVVMEVRREHFEGQLVGLRFAVRDTGIGIASGNLDKVFRAFEQADGTTTRQYGGTGLGLSISSRLVELMGGRIRVDSELGRGSTFHFTVSLGVEPMSAAGPSPVHGELAQMPVLIVDDNQTSRRILSEMLQSWNMRPITARDGQQALELLQREASRGTPVRAALIDKEMPIMDGIELARQISADDRLAETHPILLTSVLRDGDSERLVDAGIKAHIAKPLGHSELLDTLLDTVGLAHLVKHQDSLRARPDAGRYRGLRVLLTEDNLINQHLAMLLLEKHQHHVTIAGDGQQAVDRLREESFDLVLMDVQMPVLDGYAATHAIRELEAKTGHRTPIVAMTAHAMAGDRERCLEAGMDGYVAKPIVADDLYRAMDEVLAGRHIPSRFASEAPAPDTTPVEQMIRMDEPEPMPPAVNIDWSHALRHTGGDANLMRSLVALFLEESPRMLAKLEAAIEAKNPLAVKDAAHSIKGSFTYFGAEEACRLAFSLEKAGRVGDLNQAPLEFLQLSQVVKGMLPSLNQFLTAS